MHKEQQSVQLRLNEPIEAVRYWTRWEADQQFSVVWRALASSYDKLRRSCTRNLQPPTVLLFLLVSLCLVISHMYDFQACWRVWLSVCTDAHSNAKLIIQTKEVRCWCCPTCHVSSIISILCNHESHWTRSKETNHLLWWHISIFCFWQKEHSI